VLPADVVLAYVGRLTRGKLTGLEVLNDAAVADENLTLMTTMNHALTGGKPAKKYAEHLRSRASYPEEARESGSGPLPRRGEPRFATPEEIAIFQGQLNRAEQVRMHGPVAAG
jgi:hypothetical protein